jgi:DNA adenine methylase
MPYHQALLDELKSKKIADPIQRAAVFVYLSNFSFMGKNGTLQFSCQKNKERTLTNLTKYYKLLVNNIVTTVQFLNCDFKKVLTTISFRNITDQMKSFIYADPPYLATTTNYNTPSWAQKDVDDLFVVLTESGIKFAMSEFDNPYILKKAKEYNLNIIEIGERRNLRNRNTEILITNYQHKYRAQKELF